MKAKFRLIDIVSILGNILIIASCFLPFVKYTTITGTEEILYYQANGVLLIIFSALAILALLLKRFSYTFICLGLSIGVLLYDLIFGLFSVLREKTDSYQLGYAFYLIIVGMFINLIYIVLKKKDIDKQYDSYLEENNDNSSDNVIEEEIIVQTIEEPKTNDNLNTDIDSNKEEIEILSIFDTIPSVTNETIEDINEFENINVEQPLYKLCPSCGMQISYTDEDCPVCGKHF